MNLNSNKIRVLFIDDDFINDINLTNFIKFAFEKDGDIIFDFATDGDSAWKKVSVNPFPYDIIVLDIMMPPGELFSAKYELLKGNTTGFVFLRMLRYDLKNNVPVIITTIVPRAIEPADDLVYSAYIAKPIDPFKLVERIRTELLKK
jgi:CheY-like chemotaxis protein